jgi:B12-binding domain/radical SAM domain protein
LPDNLTLIAGGPHASGDPLGVFRLGFDVVVLGEGEITLPALLERLFTGRPYTDLPGLAYMEDGVIKRNRRGPWVDLDAYPPFSIKHRKLAAIEITRGCPWACAFCQTPFFMGGKMRYRSVDSIVYWLKKARRETGMRFARFISADCFAYGSATGRCPDNIEPVERLLREVSALMGKENTFFGSFPSEVRPGSVTKEGVALITKYAHNDNVVIGAQSGSNRLLEQIHRGHTIEAVYEAAEIVVAAGLTCYVDFIFGLPGETTGDRQQTIAAIGRLTKLGATINSHFFYPLPGTPLAGAAPGAPDAETLRLLQTLSNNNHAAERWRARLETLKVAPAILELAG